MGPGRGPSGSADSWDSLGRHSSGSASAFVPVSFNNPLYKGGLTRPSSSSEIQDESVYHSLAADLQTAEVHHREPLTRPLPSPLREWETRRDGGPIDVDPVSVSVIDPDGFSVYRRASTPKRNRLARILEVARHLWPASALAQAPAWFEQWWDRMGKGRQPARPKGRSAWSLIRTGELDFLDLDNQALLQVVAFLLLVLLLLLLVYIVYDSWEQGRQVITVAAAGDGKPNGRIIYMTRSQFKRERARRKGNAQPQTAAAPSVAKVSPPDTTTLYEYPPRRAL